MLERIHSQAAYYAFAALWYNAYGEMPPKNLNNLDLVNALAADKERGYKLTDIISYVFPK